MSNVTRWLSLGLVGIYALLSLSSLTFITNILIEGSAPAELSPEVTAFILSMPWSLIILGWVTLLMYFVSFSLLLLERAGAKRLLTAAIAADLLGWLWQRGVTGYAEAVTGRAELTQALLMFALIGIVVLMIVERRTGTLT